MFWQKITYTKRIFPTSKLQLIIRQVKRFNVVSPWYDQYKSGVVFYHQRQSHFFLIALELI